MSRTVVHTPPKFAYPDEVYDQDENRPKASNAYKKLLRSPLHVGDKRYDYSVLGVVTANLMPIRECFVSNVPKVKKYGYLSPIHYILNGENDYIGIHKGLYANGENVKIGKKIVSPKVSLDENLELGTRLELEIEVRKAMNVTSDPASNLSLPWWSQRNISNVDYVNRVMSRLLKETINISTTIKGEEFSIIALPVRETKIPGQYVPAEHKHGVVTYALIRDEFKRVPAQDWRLTWYHYQASLNRDTEQKMNKHYGPDPDRRWYQKPEEFSAHQIKQELNTKVRDISGMNEDDLEEIFGEY